MIGLEFDSEALRDALEARIEEKLSGQAPQARSAASVSISGVDVAPAAIQGFGGKTAAHEIVAGTAKASALGEGSGRAFARRAQHSGPGIPARSHLGGALSGVPQEIASGFKQALLDALK